MFTIKHIDKRGNEHLVQCHSFRTERRDDGFMQYLAYGENPTPGDDDYIATWCGDDNRDRSDLSWHTLYVMNRFGATVATHSFRDPDFGTGAAHADPELLAA